MTSAHFSHILTSMKYAKDMKLRWLIMRRLDTFVCQLQCSTLKRCNQMDWWGVGEWRGVPTSVEDIFPTYWLWMWTKIAQLVQRLATCWAVQGSNCHKGEIFRTCPDWPRPTLTTVQWDNWYWVSFLGVKRLGLRLRIYLYSTSAPSWSVLGWTLPLLVNMKWI